jgi:hypothetical protein
MLAAVLALAAILITTSRYVRAAARDPDLEAATRRLIGRQMPVAELRKVRSHTSEVVGFTSGGRQLLLIYSPDCAACRTALLQWEKLVAKLPATSVVQALSIKSDDAGRDTVPFFSGDRILEWHGSARALARTISARVVPITIVLSSTGVVELAEAGVPSDRAIDGLARLLKEP